MANELMIINDSNPVYCSMTPTTVAEKKVLYNAVENPTDKISALINKRIKIANVHCTQSRVVDDDGLVTDTVKTTIITPDGKGYVSPNSMGIFNAVRDLFAIFGTPDEWDEPLEVEVKQIETKNGRYFRLEVV